MIPSRGSARVVVVCLHDGVGERDVMLSGVHVFEQARQLSEVGAGLGLQQNAQRVLVLLDLGPEMIRIGSQLKGFRGARAEARRNLRLGAFDDSVAASSAFGLAPCPRPPR